MADAADLKRIYEARFAANLGYRAKLWRTLVSTFFQRHVPPESTVLDLGCGYGEFINAVRCRRKLAMDLNPDAPRHLGTEVQFLEQDCSVPWQMADATLDIVFTSNFFEHLPDKAALGRTLDEAYRCLSPGGKLIAMGPNIKHLPGRYWDFWDHYLPLTETSLAEGLRTRGFQIERSVSRFLPYTMAAGRAPQFVVQTYLRLPVAWPFFGKQFLLIARKPDNRATAAEG